MVAHVRVQAPSWPRTACAAAYRASAAPQHAWRARRACMRARAAPLQPARAWRAFPIAWALALAARARVRQRPLAAHSSPTASLSSAAHLDVDAELLHLIDGILADMLAEAQVKRAQRGAAPRESEQRRVRDQMAAAAKVE